MLKKIGNCLIANVGYNFEVASLRNILFLNTFFVGLAEVLVPENHLDQLKSEVAIASLFCQIQQPDVFY